MDPHARKSHEPGARSTLEQTSIVATLPRQHVIEYHRIGDDRLAEAEYRRQLANSPDQIEALHALAVLLGARGEYEESARLLARAVHLTPHDPNLHNDLGVTLERAGELTRAAQAYREALRLQPSLPQIWGNLANTLLHAGDPDGAIEACEQALGRQPSYPPALNILGSALVDLGRAEEALPAYRRALALWPHHAEIHTNYGLALLQCGDFENGWKEHEWRRKLLVPIFQRAGPAWDGSDPSGKTLFLYGEGGLGNVIQFARYIPLLRDRGARIVVECQSRLADSLAALPGVSTVVAPGQYPPGYDAHCPLASLPAVLGTRLDSVPAHVPYLHVDPATVAKWGPLVHAVPGFRVGVCWRGARAASEPRSRSLDPSHLLPLAKLPGVSLINLQHGHAPPPELPLHTLPGLEPDTMQLRDAAAVICHLDLVISCDTSIAHLAGALGMPVWMALRHAASWRWMQQREDTPWYPTMRLFRQATPDDWAGVFQRIAQELSAMDRGRSTTHP